MYHFAFDRYEKLNSVYNEVKSEANVLKSYNINHSLELNAINDELKIRTEEIAHLWELYSILHNIFNTWTFFSREKVIAVQIQLISELVCIQITLLLLHYYKNYII